MSKLIIGNVTFNVLKQDGTKLLLQWREASGIVKERWVVVPEYRLGLLVKVSNERLAA